MGVLTGRHIVMVPAWWPTVEQPGAGSFFVDFASVFASAGATVGVVFPELISLRQLRGPGRTPWRPQLSFESCADDIPVIRVKGWSASFGRPHAYMRRFREWLSLGLSAYIDKFGAPDLIHAGCLLPSGWAATHLDHALARRVVVTEETGPFSDVTNHPQRISMVHKAAERAAGLVAVSDILAADMKRHGIEQPIHICGNPVASAFFDAPVRATTGNARLQAVFVGRMTRLKGLDELTNVIERLDRENTSIDWHLIGSETHMGAQQLSGRLHHSRLKIWGPQPRTVVLNKLREADIFVFPTHVETFGIAVAEALCMGVPVVTTRDTGCASFIDESNGCLCDRGDADSLYNATRALLSRLDTFDRQQISTNARGRFGSDAIAARYADIFREALVSK